MKDIPSSIILVPLLVAAKVTTSVAVEHQRLLRGHVEAASVLAANVTKENATGGSLTALGKNCHCSFRANACSCAEALEFMKCIKDACDSGACDCSYYHFFYACKTFSSECQNTDLHCGAEEATCGVEPQPAQRMVVIDPEPLDLKGRMPPMPVREVRYDLDRLHTLILIWWNEMRHWAMALLLLLANILIIAFFACIYDAYRFNPRLPVAPRSVVMLIRAQGVCHCGNTYLPDSVFCRKCGMKRPEEDDFGVGLFQCLSDLKLCLFTCCCPSLRWADTMDKTGLQSYWAAFTTFIVLATLSPCTCGITGLFLVAVCVRQRRRLRRKYNVALNDPLDCFAYLCCGTCAIVQEARVQANLHK